MIVAMSPLSERKPSIDSSDFIAVGLFRRASSVLLSTFTRSADSHRLANSVTDVPDIAMSRISYASIC